MTLRILGITAVIGMSAVVTAGAQTTNSNPFGVGATLTHWAVRPDVRLLMVAGDSDRRWITTFGVHVAYYFEHHHITD